MGSNSLNFPFPLASPVPLIRAVKGPIRRPLVSYPQTNRVGTFLIATSMDVIVRRAEGCREEAEENPGAVAGVAFRDAPHDNPKIVIPVSRGRHQWQA